MKKKMKLKLLLQMPLLNNNSNKALLTIKSEKHLFAGKILVYIFKDSIQACRFKTIKYLSK